MEYSLDSFLLCSLQMVWKWKNGNLDMKEEIHDTLKVSFFLWIIFLNFRHFSSLGVLLFNNIFLLLSNIFCRIARLVSKIGRFIFYTWPVQKQKQGILLHVLLIHSFKSLWIFRIIDLRWKHILDLLFFIKSWYPTVPPGIAVLVYGFAFIVLHVLI